MRAYFFGNFYLSSIQQGIQAGHVIGNMSILYGKGSMYHEWAAEHKTIILLNGGMHSDLRKIWNHFEKKQNPYDWAYFTESFEALNGALTSVGIILPEEVYTEAALRRSSNDYESFNSNGPWESKLFDIMNGCRMAQ